MWIILPILPSIMKEGSSASDLTLPMLHFCHHNLLT